MGKHEHKGEHRDPRDLRRERGKQIIVKFTDKDKKYIEKGILAKKKKK